MAHGQALPTDRPRHAGLHGRFHSLVRFEDAVVDGCLLGREFAADGPGGSDLQRLANRIFFVSARGREEGREGRVQFGAKKYGGELEK